MRNEIHVTPAFGHVRRPNSDRSEKCVALVTGRFRFRVVRAVDQPPPTSPAICLPYPSGLASRAVDPLLLLPTGRRSSRCSVVGNAVAAVGHERLLEAPVARLPGWRVVDGPP
jgi:hypothetical protein